jgi:TonB family protein
LKAVLRPGPSRRLFAKQLLGVILGARAFTTSGDAQSKGDAQPKDDKSGNPHTGPKDPVYEPGPDVIRPKLIHYVEPSFSPKANEAFVEGTVTVSTVVNMQGVPADLHVVKGLTAAQDRSALESVKQWRFQPGTKDGKAVNVKLTIEVRFNLL